VLDEDACYRAVLHRDARFDGWFFTAVRTTGIFCRPSCPARTPHRRNVEFHPTAASAVRAGFRACLRCRPDTTPGSPEWDLAGDVAARAVRAINDGVVDREGVVGLASRLGYSPRQLQRLLTASLGAGPIELARAHRATTARTLLETTSLPITQVAYAAGFGSTRQFNETLQAMFAKTPTEIRHSRSKPRASDASPSEVALRLALRPPVAAGPLFSFHAARAAVGVETGDAHSYARTLSLPHARGILRATAPSPDARWLDCTLRLEDFRDLPAAVERTRRLFDLDADPQAVDAALGADPRLRSLVRATPGMRVPGHVDGDELAIRAVLGQQVTVAAATRIAGLLAERYGEAVACDDDPVLVRAFPDAATLAKVDPAELPMPRSRARTVVDLAAALADGIVRLDAGADREEAAIRLATIRGIGPWTVAYVRMRALGDPDAFLPSDLVARRALVRSVHGDQDVMEAAAQRWRPYRSYAMLHLWASEAARQRINSTQGQGAPQ
jgi:AraC family transcriptional regulator of adaptative response / DNA-3-methyladenine glycosylase II